MSEQRLSKLQSWIIRDCYESCKDKNNPMMYRSDIFTYYIFSNDALRETFLNRAKELKQNFRFNELKYFKKLVTPDQYNRINASISRSLVNLRDKEYVVLIGHTGEQKFFDFLGFHKDGGFEKENCPDQMDGETTFFDVLNYHNKWIKKQDVIVEITNDCEHKVKCVLLTPKGIEKAKELMGK